MTHYFWVSLLYQITRPWRWLTYGQNAAALGLVILWFYTLYTRRMMKMAEQTRRLTLTPYLVATLQGGPQPSVLVTNAAAPAVRCDMWYQITDPGQRIDLGLRFRRPSSIQISQRVGVISQQSSFVIPLRYVEDDAEIVYVLDCFDTAEGSYQLQILQKPLPGNMSDIQTAFSIPDNFRPLWKQLSNRVAQRWHLRKAAAPK